MKIDKVDVTKTLYKSAVISGCVLSANDASNYITCGRGQLTPAGKILRNLSASAIGYAIGSWAADVTYRAIERAIEQYKEA